MKSGGGGGTNKAMQDHWLSNLCYAEIKHDYIHCLAQPLTSIFRSKSPLTASNRLLELTEKLNS